MKTYILLIAFAFCGAAPSALASKCVWDPVFETTRCCGEGESAVWDPTYNTVRCISNQSPDSCVWDPVFETTRCCPKGQTAVWDPVYKTVRCR